MGELSVVQPTSPLDGSSVAEAYRLAMRRLAASVCIVTAAFDGKRLGIAATAVCSLTLDPPAMIVCINRSASVHPALHPGGNFGVNLLDRRHEDICAVFGSHQDAVDKFAFGHWVQSECGTPVLADSYAAIRCVVDSMLPYSSHSIVIGRVIGVQLSRNGNPLVYHDGKFR